jgi:uncharacterized membrane protein
MTPIKKRLKNRYFALALCALIVKMGLVCYPAANWTGIHDILMAGLDCLIALGVIIDPTTPGLKDGK